jgi:tRNA nucleotidyltransferase (CCA-adding enzyme)
VAGAARLFSTRAAGSNPSTTTTNDRLKHLHPPVAVLEIAQRLEAAGFEAWCVGGAIRDALLGHPHLDWDLATSATPTQVRELFGQRRTIPIGIEFGTVGVLDRDGLMHEVTTFRRDVRTDGRRAEVEFGVSLEQDLSRRDFTINAIAYSARLEEVRDPFGGREDLARGVVRAVGDPQARMREDRLRALRAIRFAARFDFRIDGPTLAAVADAAPFLGRLSPERVKQELEKTMDQVRCPSTALRLWRSTGAFATLIPRLAGASDEALAIPDHLARPGLRNRPARRSNRLAGLLVGLPAAEAVRVLTSLRCSRGEIQWVGALVDRWHAHGGEIERSLMTGQVPRDVEVRRWVAAIGRLHLGGFMRLAGAIWAVSRAAVPQGTPSGEPIRRLYRRMLRVAFHDVIDIGGLAIDGDDLRRIGISPGPAMGKILQALLALVLEDPACNRPAWLLDEAKRMGSEGSGVGVRG